MLRRDQRRRGIEDEEIVSNASAATIERLVEGYGSQVGIRSGRRLVFWSTCRSPPNSLMLDRRDARRWAAMQSLTPTRLVLMRHGQTATNRGGNCAPMSGWTDLPMSAEGERQVSKLVERLRAGPRFDGIYSSPLIRAAQTARALADAGLGLVRLY